LLLVTTQAVLAARGRMALHMKVGNFVMAYGGAVIVVGVIATFAAFEMGCTVADRRCTSG